MGLLRGHEAGNVPELRAKDERRGVAPLRLFSVGVNYSRMGSFAPQRIIEQLQRNRDKGDLTFDLAMLAAGRKFPAADRIDNLAAGGRAAFFIENPTDNIDYVVDTLGVKTTQLSEVIWSRGATEVTPGTEEMVPNANTMSDRTFSGSVRTTDPTETGEYTHADPFYFQDMVPGGQTGQGGGGSTGRITFTVPRNSNALITLENVTTNEARLASLPFILYEVDPTFVMSKIGATTYTDRPPFNRP